MEGKKEKMIHQMQRIRRSHLFVFVILAACLSLVCWRTSYAATTVTTPQVYTQRMILPVPVSPFGCFDIAYAHQGNYYLADSDISGILKIQVAVASSTQTIGKGDFTGRGNCLQYDYSQQGPNGILIDNRDHLWAGNGDSSVRIYNAETGKFLKKLSTGGLKRADELGYSPNTQRILVANPDELSPFVSLIDARTFTILKKISFPASTQGIEQPVWDAKTQLFYIDLLGSKGATSGSLVAISAEGIIKKTIALKNCEPGGMAIGKGSQLAIGCSGDGQAQQILDLQSGKTVLIQAGVGVDVVAYDATTNRYFYTVTDATGLFWSVAVVDGNGTLLQSIPSTAGMHTVTIDEKGRVFIPEVGRGIAVWTRTTVH